MLTRLIQGEAEGERLSHTELLHNIIFILNAGHETTTNLIGNGLVALLEWPQERARLIAQPDLIRTAVEEILRFESSNQLGNRVSTAPAEIGGVAMPAGTFITLGIGAANRDPDEFADPGPARRRPPAESAPGLRLRPARVRRPATWRGWRAASRLAASWRAFRTMRWPARPRAGAGPGSEGSRRFRLHSTKCVSR